MRRAWALSGSALLSLAAGVSLAAPGAAQKPAEVRTTGVWKAPAPLKQEPIWPGDAPDQAGVATPAESVLSRQSAEAIGSGTSETVFDVSVPTMTIYPPKGRNTHVAVVVFPGGGFTVNAITIEGTEICDWLTAKGITCVLSKYRIPGTNDYWNAKCECRITPKVPRSLQDAQRTIRLVRSRAAALGVDPKRIGVMGFSAGGYLVAQTSNVFEPIYKPVDAIDRVSSRPDFAIALYPGHLCRAGTTLDPMIHVTKQTPPTFLAQAWDDPVDDICNSTLYARALDAAHVPTEVHLFARGGHAFALRAKQKPVGLWPMLVERWLRDQDILKD